MTLRLNASVLLCYYLQMDIYTYPVKLEKRYGKYWASSETFPGMVGIGDTIEEAKASILAAMKLYIEECITENRPIPTPCDCRAETASVKV